MRYIYNQLLEDYNTLFLDNILKFKRKLEASTSGITEYVDFYPSFGIKKDEKADFLIYGQAVNGWALDLLCIMSFLIKNFKTPEGKKVLIVVNDSDSIQTFTIADKGRQAPAQLKSKAVATYIWE